MLMSAKVPAFVCAMNRSGVFPRRALLDLNGKTILEHITARLRRSGCVDGIWLCTSEEASDDDLVALAQRLGTGVVRGSAQDVCQRLARAFALTGAEEAFLIRGDTPLVDMQEGEQLLARCQEEKADFGYNEHLFGIPYGLGCEVIARQALERVVKSVPPAIYSEKISWFLRMNATEFRVVRIAWGTPNPDARFVVETQKDYEFVRELLTLVPEETSTTGLLAALQRHPYLTRLNRQASGIGEIGMGKLLLFPEKLRSLQAPGLDCTYPISVELSLTNDCNLRCHWCSDRALRQSRPGNLPFDVYARLVDDLVVHGTLGLVIEGGGEPTVYPRFKEAAALALEKGLAVGLITNGVEFDYADLMPRMEWIRVSLDADSPEAFARIKGRNCFWQVVANLRAMCSVKGRCVVGCGYVVSRDNVEHLEDVAMVLQDCGVDYLYLRPVVDHPELKITSDLLYLKKYETGQFSVMIHAMEENSITGNHGVACRAHSLSSVICADGAVFLCGRLNIHDWFKPIGNLNDASFNDIWNGPLRREQAERVAAAGFCRQWCPECRMTKFNMAVDTLNRLRTRSFI